MYKTSINGKTFEITNEKENWFVNGNPLSWDVASIGNGHCHILFENKGYQAEVVRIDKESKTIDLRINGINYSLQLKDKFDILLEKMGMNSSAAGKVNVIKAPMPGLIIDLRVQVGDVVKQGDSLLVLEAMKMENILKAPGEGIVKNVRIKKGETVEKGQLLIEF